MTSQCQQQTDPFRDLSRIFASRNGRVFEFEILPPAFGPILEDCCSIGITKKYLVQAFVTARRVFFDGLQSSKHDGSGLSPNKSERESSGAELDDKLAIASEIILLFDCEHLTACNWRKTRLCALLQSNHEKYIRALATELSLMTTYLCSPLHRHTKSPTLWQHRQWIQTQLIQASTLDLQAVQELLQTELSAVLRAGGLHPRNYYAFSYLRQIHRILCESDKERREVRSDPLARSIIPSTLDWCLAHPTDISGLMFLLYLLDAVPDTALRLGTVSKVARFAVDVGWKGESIWVFVDLTVRKFGLLNSPEDSQIYPWNILGNSLCLVRPQHDEGKANPPWKTWLDRARAHWAQSTNTQHA
ncbi:hypothetical protein BDV12DRAFT_184294 [Aspergillus spectabilis]